jgi:hypothetical protein
VPPILPRFRWNEQQAEDERKLAAILLEVEAEAHPDSNGRVHRRSADGHNKTRARGVPIIGRVGSSGASPGTDPVAALLRKEARGELRR